MFNNQDEVFKYISDEGVKYVDVRFCDLPGQMQHFTIPASELKEGVFTDGLAFVPFANGVHYDSEAQRRPLFQSLIADGTLPAGYATDDGAGVRYRGTEFVEALSEREAGGAYFVEPGPDGSAVEHHLDTRRL